MAEAWPQSAGKLADGGHVLPVRVYYEDTDLSGVVYHSNYIKYCERGRTDWLRLLGIRHADMLGKYFFVVRRLECEFYKPAKIDDLLEVHTRFEGLTGVRMHLGQRILRGEELLFEAKVTPVLIDPQGRPMRVPAEWRALFPG
jgi:acyl-CoA thioester hydrolase